MSYNGIGLSTARGSGTNGYVVRNLGHLKHRRNDFSQPDPYQDEPKIRKPNPELVVHEQKRSIEVKCATLQAELEDEGVNDDEIERQVGALREKLTVLLEKATAAAALAVTKAAEREAQEKAAAEARAARAAERAAERTSAASSGKDKSRSSRDKDQSFQQSLRFPFSLSSPTFTCFKVNKETPRRFGLKVSVACKKSSPTAR
ncbi:RNA-splicing factor [Mortierella sp. NVP85]|nr:RNA-splicing factor [Mortierella sp. NVP85]